MSFKEMDIYTESDVILALRNSLGNIMITAAELNVSRGQLMDYLAHNEGAMKERLQLKEALLDQAESILVDKMKTSDALLMFFLRTQGKSRGYDSSVSVSGPNGSPIQVNLNARALIAAMRNGFETSAEEESKPEDGNLLDE